jgi:hypothetical protein
MQQRHQKSLRLFRSEKFILTQDPGSALHRSYLLQRYNVASVNIEISDPEYERLIDITTRALAEVFDKRRGSSVLRVFFMASNRFN